MKQNYGRIKKSQVEWSRDIVVLRWVKYSEVEPL